MTATTDPRPVATQPLEPDRPAMSHREVLEALSGLLLSPRERGRYAGYLGEVFGVGTVAGIAMFGTTVFLSRYMQIARGKSPTESGLLTIPLVVGRFFASTFIGRLVSRTGRYKRFLLRDRRGEIFLYAAPLGLVTLAAVALLRELPLGGKSGIDIARERASESTHDHQGATA